MGKQPNVAGVQAEDDLIARARQGDGFAWAELVARYRPVVERHIRRFCGQNHDLFSEEDSEDLVQEVFLRAFRNLDTFRGDCAFSTWLFYIAASTCEDERRKRERIRRKGEVDSYEEQVEQGREPSAEELPGEGLELRPYKKSPEEVYLIKDRAEVVQRAVNRLPADLRIVVILRDFQGLEWTEIGAALGISSSTAHDRHRKALRQLARDPELCQYFETQFVTVSGQVREGSDDKTVGKAVPKATVSMGPYQDETDENGRYTLAQVPAAQWEIKATKRGYRTYSQTVKLRFRAGQCEHDIVLEPIPIQTETDGNVSTSPTDSEKGGTSCEN